MRVAKWQSRRKFLFGEMLSCGICNWRGSFKIDVYGHQTSEQKLSVLIVFDRLASRVLCATLAVPLPVARHQSDQLLDLDDSGVEKQKRLATLMSLNSLPTRHTLVKELVSAVCS